MCLIGILSGNATFKALLFRFDRPTSERLLLMHGENEYMFCINGTQTYVAANLFRIDRPASKRLFLAVIQVFRSSNSKPRLVGF